MEAFLFDMDGVIVDTQQYHSRAVQQVFTEIGVSVSLAELSQYAGTKRGASFRGIAAQRGLKLPVEQLSARKDVLFNDIIAHTQLQPIEGIPELLAKLQAAGIPMAIASSSSDAFIAYIVDCLHIRSFFDALLSGENLPESKPNPAIYQLTAQTLGVAPEQCVVLEDAALGVQAAKAAGMYCIGYQNPHSGQQDLSHADEIVASIRDIHID